MTERGVAAAASHLSVKPRSARPTPYAQHPIVRNGTTRGPGALKDFALAARDSYSDLAQQFETFEGIAGFGCLVR